MLNIFNTNEKPNENKNRENENEKENGNENDKKDLLIQLQLGDIIELYDPKNEKINGQIFYIDYIDKSKMNLINESTLETIKFLSFISSCFLFFFASNFFI